MTRPRIAFFDFHDVLEDFYPRYGVTAEAFATTWAATGNHAWVTLLQREVGDVTWICASLDAPTAGARHEVTSAQVVVTRSSWAHRQAWRGYYLSRHAWRWQQHYRGYGTAASYLAPLSRSTLGALRAARPELVVLQDYATGRFDVLAGAARALGARVVAYHSGSTPEAYRGAALRRATLRLADRLFVSSAAEADWLRARFGVPRRRLRVLLTPVDTDVFRSGAWMIASSASARSSTRSRGSPAPSWSSPATARTGARLRRAPPSARRAACGSAAGSTARPSCFPAPTAWSSRRAARVSRPSSVRRWPAARRSWPHASAAWRSSSSPGAPAGSSSPVTTRRWPALCARRWTAAPPRCAPPRARRRSRASRRA